MVRAINPPGMPAHQNPIPSAAMHRGLLISSVITGMDPESQTYPADKTVQTALAFKHLKLILDEAGASAQDVVKLDLYFADTKDRALANPLWVEMYPDENARPARHAHHGALPAGSCIQIVVTAMLAP